MITLVTGGAGFIGSHVAEELVSRGHETRILDNLSTGKDDNLKALGKQAKKFYFSGPFCEKTTKKALRGVDVVFHLAAIPSVPLSVRDPDKTHENGTQLTFRLLEMSRRAGIRRIVFSSSSSVYGGISVLNNNGQSENQPTCPASPYAATKVAGEAYMRAFAECYDIDTVSLRYFNVYGPRQDPGSAYAAVIAKFCKSARENSPLVIHGTGQQTRDFTYVTDVALANVMAGERAKDFGGLAMNVGNGTPVSVLELAELIREISGQDLKVERSERRPGDVDFSMADTRLIRENLGWKPGINIRDGLGKMLGN